ncbi:MAG: chemotaxis protein CheA [Sulfurospirillaceae bacterium]|nr:chemotaxis protein CheA [Sulfurospirillaceae bacterium]MCK9545718.1 chemotaxis protein CheA [Sulfurospirillaceae bacterium]
MDINKLKEIFIEEANEIVEKLDVDIINFEENPEDKELLNELFRGVHTLKGSANSFGFTRLGEFVHHFEDALDFYRNSDEKVTSKIIDIFLNAVDLIKEVMFVEIDGIDGLPDGYEKSLLEIKSLLGNGDFVEVLNEELDLAAEFGNEEIGLESLKDKLLDDEKLYKITLTIDDDIYFRGFDHARFFQLLSQDGHLLESYWNFNEELNLDDFSTDKAFIKDIEIYLASSKEAKLIKENFEYLEDNEFKIEALTTTILEPKIKEQESAQEPKTQRNHRKNDAASFVRIDTNKLDELFDSVGELVIAQNFLEESEDILNIKNENVTKTINILSKITRLIQNRVMGLRMVPIQDTFDKMRRVVRDASKKVDKEIDLVIEGGDTEIDKTMIDSLSDPLIHLIRNSVDHGIEPTKNERVALGKSEVGTVTLRAYHRGGNVAIEIIDDGKGIDRDRVLSKAIERGLVSSDDELSDAQIYSLIMQAGFSTAAQISDVSGRGVGLDVVRSSIEKLNGKVEISSTKDEGTVFTILLPLTLAIIDGMLVKCENDTYIIPTLSVLESFIPKKENVHTFKNEGEFIDLRGNMIPIVRLAKILNTQTKTVSPTESTLVCIESEKGRYALLIDDLIGRQQVVIKPLGYALSSIKEFSGSAIMGNGDIALILNTEELFLPEGLS